MSTRKIASLIREMYGNYRNDDLVRAAKKEVDDLARRYNLPVEISHLAADSDTTSDTPEIKDAPERGDRILKLYFAQLFHGPRTLLDLRHERFTGGDPNLVWNPTRLVIKWDEPFLSAIQEMYAGFYTDDDARFEAALKQLDLWSVADLFRQHFGEGDQRNVSFSVEEFRDIFRQILSRCKDEGIELHRQFGALGVYLGCLYDHLESLGGSYDVRAAVEWAMAPDSFIAP